MRKFLREAHTAQAVFVVGFVKQIVNRFTAYGDFSVGTFAFFGERSTIDLNDSCYIRRVFGKVKVEFKLFFGFWNE